MNGPILVTGASGFLGSTLVSFLVRQGNEVHVLQRDTSDTAVLAGAVAAGAVVHRFTRHADIAGIVHQVAPGTVFHLATLYLKDHRAEDIPALIEANISFGTHLLEALDGSKSTVLTAMSYFQFRDGVPQPYSLYSAMKQAFLEIGDFYRERRGLDVRNVVLYDTYGPGDRRPKLVTHLVDAAVRRQPVSLGASAQGMNLLYSDDVVAGLVAAVAGPPAAIRALRSPVPTTVGEIVAVLEDVVGHPLEKKFNDGAAVNTLFETSGSWPTPEGWVPRASLREGLQRTLEAAR